MVLSAIKKFFRFTDRNHKSKGLKESKQDIIILEHKDSSQPYEFVIWPIWPDKIICYIICPTCKENILISKNHSVAINPNGTITIDASILHDSCGAHFWVKENKVYEA